MKARKGEWFSLSWDIIDFYDPEAFDQYKKAPRFLWAKENSNQIEYKAIQEFNRLRLVQILLTSVFITDDLGRKLPTHYRFGEFMPGDKPRYDKWLREHHALLPEVFEEVQELEFMEQQKVFLEHTAKVIRHDMHSGINTYIPRGFKALLKKLSLEAIEELDLGAPLKLLEEGIIWTKRVYDGVYAFTSLVKQNAVLEKENFSLKEALIEHLSRTAYADKVEVGDLPFIHANKSLMCTALDFLIRGGLKFNKSEKPFVKVYMQSNDVLCLEDNGVGLSLRDFLIYCKPYEREGSSVVQGLELNIATAIIIKHGFPIEPQKTETGTIFRIGIGIKVKQYLIENTTMLGRFSVEEK